MKEDEFFNRIATRLGRSAPLNAAPSRDVVGAPSFWRDYALAGDELIAKFATELEKIGGTVHVFASKSALLNGVQEVLAQLQPTSVAMWGGAFAEELPLDSLLTGYEVVQWGLEPASVARVSQVDVGITGCDFAIADTGTVVLMSNPTNGRSVSLLPSVHVVVVKESALRTRMGEVWEEIGLSRGEQPLSSSINFISGPSRSSDIENDLSIGVHGPAAVFALVWRGA